MRGAMENFSYQIFEFHFSFSYTSQIIVSSFCVNLLFAFFQGLI